MTSDPVALLHTVTGALTSGEDRPQQSAMCRAVAEAIASRRHLVVQAGTGTGKSLAYLVPAVASGEKVVVATATKSLQDQLATKDLPLVRDALGGRLSFAVLKGRSNYLCRQRAAEVGLDGVQPSLEGAGGTAGGGLVDQVRRLLAWADESPTGDRAELPFEPHPRAWAMLSVGPRECPGAYRCPSGDTCFAEAARAAAAAADVVVVNTHLYGAHLASGGAVLPEHRVVVFDEAHEVEEVMTQSLGTELTTGRIRALVAQVRPLLAGADGREALDALTRSADGLEGALRLLAGSRVPPAPDDEGLGVLLVRLATELATLTSRLEAGARAEGEEAAKVPRALSAAGHLAGDVHRLLDAGDGEVVWVDGSVLRLSPIDVGPPLAATLWGDVTAVLTSATVPLRLPEHLGLDGFAVDQLDVGSPFDYRTHSLLYVARHLPDRRSPEAEAALHDELAALITAAGGRTLALFTSRRATETAAEVLAGKLEVPVLVQGQRPKARLLEAFTEDEASCLFATLGFWQGVDVPGRSLSLVTLDRLPFGRPDDPLLAARRERAGAAAFRTVDLPRAAALLAQGAGRLIRTAEDRGVVAVLDPRLATAGYRGVLLAALPPMRRTTDRRQVEDFLTRILAA